MKRKIIDDLIKWKENKNHKPLIIYGARQVGKTYIIKEFAKEYYENIYEINFELSPEAKWIFDGSLNVNDLLIKLSASNTSVNIKAGKTLLFFDEVQKCPQVLTSLKAFALDKRFDVIVSGSMLGIIMDKVASFPVGYVDDMTLRPMTFEEFLWANNYNDMLIEEFKKYFDNEQLVPEAIHQKLNELFLQYIVVGGMPEAVQTFIDTKNIQDVIIVQKKILKGYKNDIAKYASNNIKEKVRECYDAIPDQLAKENKKFQYKLVKVGGNARFFASSLGWISDSGFGFKVERLKTLDLPLRAYRDISSFKFYFIDTGLLLSLYEEDVQSNILQGDLGVLKGGIFENIIAQSLLANNMPIYYYRRDDKMEIDFVTYYKENIVPIEVKSSKNTKSISLSRLLINKKSNVKYGIKLSMNNINCNNDLIKCYPLYMVMFIKN